jgi:uroporphyrinogen decarboxylase
MLPRDRVASAIEFRPPDVIPLQICAAPGGFHEHGQKLLDLIRQCGHDFGDPAAMALPPSPAPADYDANGQYHAIRTDEWGTTWEYLIYGVCGHPIGWPLDDLAKLATYRMPPVRPTSGADLENAKRAAAEHRKRYFLAHGWTNILERMVALRRFEDVLMDIAEGSPEINQLADRLAERAMREVEYGLALGADGIVFGDDFGTTETCLISPQSWRQFIKPRYKTLFEPIRRAGRKVMFHSCGMIWDLLEDMREIGVDTLWPQLPVYEMPSLAKRCRDLGIAVQLHPDRGDLMQRATPAQVHDYVLRMIDTFGTAKGGSWLYIEIDPGFPWANVEALFEVAMELRCK